MLFKKVNEIIRHNQLTVSVHVQGCSVCHIVWLPSYHGGPGQILANPFKICSGLNGKCLISSVQSPFLWCTIIIWGVGLAWPVLRRPASSWIWRRVRFGEAFTLLLEGGCEPSLERFELHCRWTQWSPPKRWHVYTKLHWVLSQKTEIWPLKCLNQFLVLT
jgi:hypothetical protein